MKRLFRKDNRIARLVAMWLVFIMALTPLYEHSGLKNPTRAASGNIEHDFSVDVAALGTDGIKVTYDTTNTKYTITGYGGHKMLYFAPSSVNDETVDATVSVSGDLVYTDPSGATVNPDYEYGVVKYNKDTSPTSSIAVADVTTAGLVNVSAGNSATLTLANGDKYAIYVRVKEFTYTTTEDLDSDGNPDTATAADANNTWDLLTYYTLEQQYDILSTGASVLTSGGAAVTNDKYYKEAYATTQTMKNATAAGDVYVGDVVVYYGLHNGSNDIDDYTLSSMSEANPGEKLIFNNDGEYIAFATYKADSDESADTVTYSTALNYNRFNVDTKDPELLTSFSNGTFPMLQDGKTGSTLSPEGGVYYLDANAQYGYMYKIAVKEANNPVQLTIIATNVDDSSDVHTYTSINNNFGAGNGGIYTFNGITSGLVVGETYKYTIDLKDKADNGSIQDVDSYTVKIIDPALQLKDISLTDGTNTKTASDTKYDTNIDIADTQTKVQQTLSLKIESGYKIKTVKLMAKDAGGNDVELDNQSTNASNASKNGGVFTYDAQFKLPKTEGVSAKYSSIKLIVEDNNGKAITLYINGDLEYDAKAPDIVANGVQKQTDGKGPWETLDLAAGSKIIVSKSDDNKDVYRFYFTVTDDLTGVNNVSYSYSNDITTSIGTLTKEGSKNSYYIDIDNATLYGYLTTNSLASMYICASATDNAENTTDTVVQSAYGVASPITELKVEGVLVKSDNTTVNLKSDEFPTDTSFDKGQFKIKITASSGYPIDKIVLKDKNGNEVGKIENLGSVCKLESDDRWYLDDAHGNTQYITVPEGTTANALLEELTVTVTDAGEYDAVNDVYTVAPVSKDIKVGTLIFDSTLPELILNSRKDANTSFAADSVLKNTTTWYQYGHEIQAIFTPGDQTVESYIDVTQYTISGAKDNKYNTTTPIETGVTKNYDYVTANEVGGENNDSKLEIKMPESANAKGTTLTLTVKDKAGNELAEGSRTIVRLVDNSYPSVSAILINGYEYDGIPVGKNVSLSAEATDNLAIGSFKVEITDANGKVVGTIDKAYGEAEALNMNSDKVTVKEGLELTLADGTYTINSKVVDKSGKETKAMSTQFEVDSTLPEVTAKISSGTTAGKHVLHNSDNTVRDRYYKSDVVVTFTCSDKNKMERKVTDNGTSVDSRVSWKYNETDKLWEGTYVATANPDTEVKHNVVVTAKDSTGNEASATVAEFIVDKDAPTIGATLAGMPYEGGAPVYTSDVTLALSESETYKDANGFHYALTKKVPDEAEKKGDSLPTAHRSFTYTEEAEYVITVYSEDMAGNRSETKTIQFKLDKTAPNISIGGIGDGGTSSSAVTVSLNMQELYWSDAAGTVAIYMKSGEGFGEELVEEFAYTPTGRNTSIARTFAESGIYRIEFNAQDAAQHTATASSTFTIDTEAPVVTLEGVSNFDVTDQSVTITSTITDKFYASKQVTVSGTMTDETGKVTPITINNYSATANPTTINETFSTDGIYDLTITCVDIAGNSDSKSVHFIIDKTAPVIGDLSEYDNKIRTEFVWDKDLDDLVSDLTVCDVHMYLNGQEYNGEDAVEDGSYVLLITAEDELGHTSEKSVEFVLDTKAPVFIVTGVEDGDSKIEPYHITVTVQLDEDTLDTVMLDGEVITFSGNSVTFDVTEIGEHKLHVEAYDAAGNIASADYEFELEEEVEFNFGLLIGLIALLLAAIIIFIVLKKKKKDE